MAIKLPSPLSSLLLYLPALLVLVILLPLLFLPQLISSDWARAKIEQQLAAKTHGLVETDKIQLSWFSGIGVKGLRFTNEQHGIFLTVDEITTEKGLFSYLINRSDLGQLRLISPVATVRVNSDTSQGSPPQQIQGKPSPQAGGKAHGSEPSGGTGQGPEPFSAIAKYQLKLEVVDGRILSVSGNSPAIPVMEAFNLDLGFNGPAGLLSYALSLRDTSGKGEVQGKGEIRLKGGRMDSSNSVVTIVDWQIKELLELCAEPLHLSEIPMGQGVVNAELKITGAKTSGFEAMGSLDAKTVSLYGGPLSSDTLAISDLHLDLHLVEKNERLDLREANLISPLLQGSLQGSIQRGKIHSLITKAEFDLAKIAAALPTTLGLREDLTISQGKMVLDAKLADEDGATSFNLAADLDRLQGVVGDKKIGWEQPLRFTAQGRQGAKELQLDQILVESSFFKLTGSGDHNEIKMQLKADINDALLELGQFIDLGHWSGAGSMAMDLALSNVESTKPLLAADLAISTFSLDHKKLSLIPDSELAVKLTTLLVRGEEAKIAGIKDTSLTFSTWLGNGNLSVGHFLPENKEQEGELEGARLQTLIDLQQLTPLLQNVAGLPGNHEFTGIVDVTLAADGHPLQQPQVTFDARLQPFRLKTDGSTVIDEEIIVALAGKGDLGSKDFSLTRFQIDSKAMSLQGEASLKEEEKGSIFTAKGMSRMDGKRLGEQLESLAGLELMMEGVSETPFTMRVETGETPLATLKSSSFDSSLFFDRIVGYGLEVESLQIPLRLEKALGMIDINGTVNGGQLTFSPRFDLSAKPAILFVEDNSRIFDQIALNDGMSKDLLAKIHPLFVGVAVSQGTISMDCNHLHWPLDKARQEEASFTGTMVFNDVKIQAGQLLSPLLTAMNEKHQDLTIGEQPMTCTTRDQRIHCSPLTATVNTYSLSLEGSVGFDQSLDYRAIIPVTSKMVSGDIYKYLEGTEITVPIGGSLSRPAINDDFIEKALADLILQAGSKRLGEKAGKLLQRLFQ